LYFSGRMNAELTKAVTFITLIFLLLAGKAFAQFKWVEIGVDGLTCSQCTKSVEMSIRKLDFVKNVEMNLEHTKGKITFKDGAKVSIGQIAQAVVNAGFSVRYLQAGFLFENITINKGYCFSNEGKQYQFVKTETKTLNGETVIKFIGKKFQSGKEYQHWKADLVPVCDKSKGEILYVTL
jgi:copper chaperone CopZ